MGTGLEKYLFVNMRVMELFVQKPFRGICYKKKRRRIKIEWNKRKVEEQFHERTLCTFYRYFQRNIPTLQGVWIFLTNSIDNSVNSKSFRFVSGCLSVNLNENNSVALQSRIEVESSQG